MRSTRIRSTATMRYWKKKKTNATFGIDEKGWVLVVLSLDSRWRRFINVIAVPKSDRSLIGAFLPDLFSVRYHFF